MKTPQPSLYPVLLAISVFALIQGLATKVSAQFPAGDLIVTVEELEGGEARFTLAGSAPLREAGNINATGYDSTAGTPPANLTDWTNLPLSAGLMLSAGGFENKALPVGLTLTVQPEVMSEPEEGGSVADLITEQVRDLEYVNFRGGGAFASSVERAHKSLPCRNGTG